MTFDKETNKKEYLSLKLWVDILRERGHVMRMSVCVDINLIHPPPGFSSTELKSFNDHSNIKTKCHM